MRDIVPKKVGAVGQQPEAGATASTTTATLGDRSYQKYLDGYSSLRFRPVKPVKPHAAHIHKAEITIQVRAPPAPPAATSSGHDLRTCLLDELKAKHPPREYVRRGAGGGGVEVDGGAFARRREHLYQKQKQPLAPPPPPPPPPPPLPMASPARRRSFGSVASVEDVVVGRTEAPTVTRIPAGGRIDRDDPGVRRLVYATLRNYVGAYNHRANRLAAQHGHVVQDKGVADQITSIAASGNLAHLNGRINPKANE